MEGFRRNVGSPVVVAISSALLSSYYDARLGLGTGTGTAASTAKAAPTPPWQSTSTAPKQSALVKSVLSGTNVFNASATQLSAPGATQSSDYKNLFALYQGINALQGLASDAAASGVTPAQQASYQAAFAKGMTQLQTFLGQTSFKGLDVAQGTLTASDQTTEGAPVSDDTYTTGTLFSGGPNDPVPAFQGTVAFALTLTNPQGGAKTVNFDLSQMGSTTRSMGNVVNYLNSQLAAAGVATRFKDVDTPATPTTSTVNGKTVTTPAGPDSYALKLVGVSTEAASFSAPSSTPAVYLTGTSGTPAAAATVTTPAVTGDQTQQLLKFDAGAASPSAALVSKDALPSSVQSTLASATGPDGSLYVVANVNGAISGQSIDGAQDVALMKYDSAGNLIYTRTLGASNSASGYAIAVSADGNSVAVAGSVTGALDTAHPGQSATATNSFVSEYGAALGSEQWTTVKPSTAGDVASGVAFGADGSVYVTGTAQGSMGGGANQIGGQDGYLRRYSPAGVLASTTEFGTTGTDKPAGIAVSGSSIYIAGAEGGDAVVRQFTVPASGAPVAGAVRDLGALKGGGVAGVSVAADGSVVVAGSTHNGALSAGSVTTAYASGQEAFVARLSANLAPASSDRLTYMGGSGDVTTNAMTFSGGKLYIAGQVATPPPSGSGLTNTAKGFVAAIDPATGAIGWSQQFQGTDDKAAATSIAVAQGGASVLDKLGLPTSVNYAQSTLLVDNTSLRPGDSFYVQAGSGAPQKVTIAATDTLQTLANAIKRASGFTTTITTPTVNGQTQLKIVPMPGAAAVKLVAGPQGSDALAPLGLTAGEISTDVGQTTSAGHTAKVTLGLNLSTSINLGSATAIKQATSALALASAKIQNAYQSLANPTGSTASTASTANLAYINARTSDYQQALQRLNSASS